MSNKKQLILIDGSSYFYRAFHALPPLKNAKDQPTGAVYGVSNMVKKLLKDYPTEWVAVVFDTPGKTFRDELYPEYKATRASMPDELVQQFEPLVAVIEALGIPVLSVDGVEADDVIGTLAKQASQADYSVLISTGDKDMAQLVNENVTLINTMSNKYLDRQGVIEKFGVEPHQMIDYLSLVGDTSDNIPGIPNVGPKTAAKWLQRYHSLDELIKHADDIKGKVGENLRNHRATLDLAKQLVTIQTDVTLPLAFNELQLRDADNVQLLRLVTDLEFKTWIKELQKTTEPPSKQNEFELIATDPQWQAWLKQLSQAKQFVIDTETTALNYMQARLVGLSFTLDGKKNAYLPLAHDYEDAPKQLAQEPILTALKPILENPAIKKIGQHIKYDMHIFAHYGIEMQGIAFDTMLESYVLNPAAGRHDMDTLALNYLGKNTIHYEDIAGRGAKQRPFNQIPLEQAAPYAAEDAEITFQLHETLWPKIKAIEPLAHVLQTIEIPLVPVLFRIEHHGVLIDPTLLSTQSEEMNERLNELEKQAYALAKKPFNMNSPKQLQAILFEELQIPILKKTPKGQPSTAESVLQELAYDYPLPKCILEYRSLSKLKSTYLDRLPQQINEHTGRIHTSYNQAVTSTGRLSSTDPNLQNIPIRTEQGRRVRQAFIAPTGYKIVAADYSQIELRIMAHLSKDASLLKSFADDLDIHCFTASEIFQVSLDEVTSEQRRHAKAINFGLIYGMSAYGLAKQINASREVAEAYIGVYFDRYPGVKQYMESTRALARKNGYVETIYGRRLYLPDIHAGNLQRQRAAERTAINAPMQGSAADIIKRAMITMDAWLQTAEVQAHMIMQVHDELVFEVKNEHIEKLKHAIQQHMCQAAELRVPLTVSIGVGDNWEEAH